MTLLKTVLATLAFAVVANAQAPSAASAPAATTSTTTTTTTAPTAKGAAMASAAASGTDSIKAACGQELAKAPACASEAVGHGMIMCLNKNVGKAITKDCRTAMKSAHGAMDAAKH